MSQVVRGILFISLIVLLAGCSSPYRNTKEGERLSGRYISFETPGTEWEISKEYETATYKARGIEPSPRRDNFINLVRYAPGAKLNIDVSFYQYRGESGQGFFDKNSEYKKVLKDEDMVFDSVDKEQGINYIRAWVTYVRGMRCHNTVFSRGYGGLMASVANKNYSLVCGYYDQEEGERILMISSRYSYAADATRHEKDKGIPKSELLTQSQAEMMLKQAVKRVVDSIEIKNLDRDRMEREGLMHYGKQFEISPF